MTGKKGRSGRKKTAGAGDKAAVQVRLDASEQMILDRIVARQKAILVPAGGKASKAGAIRWLILREGVAMDGGTS